MTFKAYLRRLGQRLREHRMRCGLKQVDIQEKCGITYRHYQNIEAGRVNVTVETLYRLARVFKVAIQDLVGEDE